MIMLAVRIVTADVIAPTSTEAKQSRFRVKFSHDTEYLNFLEGSVQIMIMTTLPTTTIMTRNKIRLNLVNVKIVVSERYGQT